jgi:hypothetical protein
MPQAPNLSVIFTLDSLLNLSRSLGTCQNAQGIIMRAYQKIVDKIAKAKFITIWFTTMVSRKEIGSTNKSKQATMHTHWYTKVLTWDLE